MTRAERLRRQLEEGLQPTTLEITNQSAQHHGHSGDDGSGESHFAIRIAAPALNGLTRISQHRAVHDAIGEKLMGEIHALSISVI